MFDYKDHSVDKEFLIKVLLLNLINQFQCFLQPMLSHIVIPRKYILENHFRYDRKVVFTLWWKFSSILRLLFLRLLLFISIPLLINLFLIQTKPVAVEFLLWFGFEFRTLGQGFVVEALLFL